MPSPTMMQAITHMPRSLSGLLEHDSNRLSINHLHKRGRKRQCYDWIFSSSTNIHVAVDRASFRTYTPFISYVRTFAHHRKVAVAGVGTVELRIKCKPGSKTDRTVILEDVLHIPDWLCNIFSSTYFSKLPGFDYTWTEFGIHFVVLEKNELRNFGYTEDFCGLDRLVLSKRPDGRSPMRDDREREVYSVNVTWSAGQQDKWRHAAPRHEDHSHIRNRWAYAVTPSLQGYDNKPAPQIRLGEVDENIAQVNSTPQKSKSRSSLKATVSSMRLYRS